VKRFKTETAAHS